MKLRFDEQSHAYWLDGKRCKSVTAVAKIPDDLYRLQQWEKRQVAIGLASDTDLLEAVAAHVDDNDILNDLCDQAKEKAGANRGSRRGTAAHRVTERHDAGQDVIATPMATDILAGWTEILDAAGLEVIPEFMERIVVFPHQKICGKFDRICRTRKGRLVIVDLKSGAKAIDYPHAAAIQLGLYANAPLIAGTLNARGETETFEPLPEMDKRYGVIIHLPEDGPARAVKLDIAEGWRVAQQVCFPTIEWRKIPREVLVQPLAALAPVPPPPAPDEGDELPDAEVAKLRSEFAECDNAKQVVQWIKESVEAGCSFNINGPYCRPTERRFAIIRAAIAWACHGDDVTRAAIGLAIEEVVEPAETVGCALGSLTTYEAETLTRLASALDDGALTLRFAEDGTPVLSETQPDRAA